MADGSSLFYSNIYLGGRGGMNPGQLKVHEEGFVWRKSGGGKVVEVAKGDISSLSWLRVPKGFQLSLRLKAGFKVKFNGFREQDVPNLNPFLESTLGHTAPETEMAISGRNWGEAEVDGSMLSFTCGGRQAFEIGIADVSQTQMQGKNEVMLELHVDDTAGANEKDTLMEVTFHIPNTNTTYIGDEDKPSAQVFKEKILARADVGPSGAESVAEFEGVHILTPRGRFKVELHISFMRLQGMAVDFKIQYSSVVRIFVLPKSNQPQTFVVIMLDPPIRKGQTLYPHLVLQFPNDESHECDLAISTELLEGKYKGRLQASYSGLLFEVFAQVLKGLLTDAKMTRPGSFRSDSGGHAVRTSLKAEDGYLYPLERSFFFLPKPPTLITHEEIEHIEFERHGAGSSSVSSSYFDLVIRLNSEVEYQFRNIQRNEYHNLFNFFSSKHLKILNLGESQAVASGAASRFTESDDDRAADPYLHKIVAEGAAQPDEDSDEEDEDFVANKDDDGSPTDDSGNEEGGDDDDDGNASDDSGDGDGSDDERGKKRETVKEAVKPKERSAPPPKRSIPAASAVGPAAKKAKVQKQSKDEDDGGKKKKKKDPNAPKRGLSAFMYFSQEQREIIKRENPSLTFGELGKALGERWKKLDAEEKAPYEAQAKTDKARYTKQMASYKGGDEFE